MKLIKNLRESVKTNKSILLTLTLLLSLTFIYGCQCSGSIGNSSQNTEVNSLAESK